MIDYRIEVRFGPMAWEGAVIDERTGDQVHLTVCHRSPEAAVAAASAWLARHRDRIAERENE